MSAYLVQNFIFKHENDVEYLTIKMDLFSLVHNENLVLSKKRFRSKKHYLNNCFDPYFANRAAYFVSKVNQNLFVDSDISASSEIEYQILLFMAYISRKI